MKKQCDLCGGTGRVRDSAGHTDICSRCIGLGEVEVDQPRSAGEARKSSRFYIILGIVAFFLGFYYIILYLAITKLGFSLFITIIFFVGGHVAIFGGFLFYVLFKQLQVNRGES